MTWPEAYLEQAQSDFDCFRHLSEHRFPKCLQLHYLQMSTEKLAKAFLCADNKPHDKTHYAFVRFLRSLPRSSNAASLLGFQNNKNFISYTKGLLPIAEQVERLAPVGGDFGKLNSEYPWSDLNNSVTVPAQYEYNEFKPNELIKLEKFMVNFLRIARQVAN